MKNAARCNIKLYEFWDYTPDELMIMITNNLDREKEEYKLSLIQAYLTAGWQRQKKMPSLESVMGKLDKPIKKEQSTEEMLVVVKALNAALGGTS